jgi:hypothetical protein
MKTNFASVAEAVAHYFELGYVTSKQPDRDTRYMTNGKDTIVIKRTALLTVYVYQA